jgi:hypothetical protein
MMRMLIIGYCYGLRSERKLTQEVELHLAYRWFSRLDLDHKVPHHSTFSENRLHRFRESDLFRNIVERVVAAWRLVWSRVKDSRWMPASWRPMPAVITARRQTRSHGASPNARREQ